MRPVTTPEDVPYVTGDELRSRSVTGPFVLAPTRPRDGEPCRHPGCLSHVSHPCEGCGRVAGTAPGKIFARRMAQAIHDHTYRDQHWSTYGMLPSVEELTQIIERYLPR